VATETVSPYFRAPVSVGEKGIPGEIVKGPIAETLFAYGSEIIARPSATGHYLVPELEVKPDAVDLAYGFGTASPRGRNIRFDKDRGEVTVRVVVPEAAVERAVLEMQQGSRNVWNLSELSDWLARSAYEAGQAAGRALAEAAQITHKSVAEAAQVTPEALAEAAKGFSVLPKGPHATPVRPQETAVDNEAAKIVKIVETSVGDESVAPLPDDASVRQLTARLSELTGLHDDELAQLFLGQASRERVSREHYQRWRTGKKENATAANRRRMWFLVRLFERLARAEIGIRDWVRNTTEMGDMTPFELLRLGRFDDVEHLAARLMPVPERNEVISPEGLPVLLEQGPASFTPRSEEPTTDLVFEDEDDWVETEDDVEDETDDE
jgi:hypothetical protein